MELILPLDALYKIRTDLSEITVLSRIHLTLKPPNRRGVNRGTQKQDKYKTLTVDFPVRVVSSMPMEERRDDILSHEVEQNTIMSVLEAE